MIRTEETEIRGSWVEHDHRMEADDTCQRIVSLIRDYLRELSRAASGWDILYLDPADGRFWELIYPESDRFGGGPPTLRCISSDEAKTKYSHLIAHRGGPLP